MTWQKYINLYDILSLNFKQFFYKPRTIHSLKKFTTTTLKKNGFRVKTSSEFVDLDWFFSSKHKMALSARFYHEKIYNKPSIIHLEYQFPSALCDSSLIYFGEHTLQKICLDICETLCHELRHQYQMDLYCGPSLMLLQYKFFTDEYSADHEYYSKKIEVDAFSQSIALGLRLVQGNADTAILRKYQKNYDLINPDFKRYYLTFGPNSKIVRKLLKKTYLALCQIQEFDKKYQICNNTPIK